MVFAITIADILAQWDSVGVFDFLLPFLLVFALVYGILTATNLLGGQKPLNVVIALAIGFMALRLPYVSIFFSEIFPRLGVGIVILLVLFLLAGLFIPADERRFWMWGFGAIAFIIFIVVISQSFDQFSWYSGGIYEEYIGLIIGAVLIIGLIIAVAASGGPPKDSGKPRKLEIDLGPWRK